MGFSCSLNSLSLSFSVHVIVLLLYSSSTISAITGGNETDLQALLEFKAKVTHDPFGVLSLWNGTIDFCQWYGIRCGRRHHRVTMLNLQSFKLEGSISPHISNLSFLTELNLQNNSFTHEIPREIGHLRRLKHLYLNNNSIGGKIPTNISSCFNLITVDLATNKLEGDIPMELGSLLKLQTFFVSFNNLTGSIPHSLGNLSSLENFGLAYNKLVGSIPKPLGQLTKLKWLCFVSNKLSGNIPPSIFNISSIVSLDLGDNNLQGSLPPDLFISLPNVWLFSVSINRITGSIPISLSNASNMNFFLLGQNKLTGKVPSLGKLKELTKLNIRLNHLGNGEANDISFLSSLINASKLERVDVGYNNFGGAFPERISNFSIKLTHFSLQDNQIHGSIPLKIENLPNLQSFVVGNNQLSGIIPPTIGKLKNLVWLNLGDSRFSGHIPYSIGNLTNLIYLHLQGNSLQGNIPSILGECKNLLILDLSKNNLTGVIPPQVIGLSSLSRDLDLSNNHLFGTLPMEIGNLKNLNFLDLSENMLSGEIPSTLGGCVRLEFLNMSGNFLQGPIPSSLSSLRGLQFFDLHGNNFSGEIPEFLSRFDMLWYLNLSSNNFEGMVPTHGVFKNASAFSIRRNSKLCGGIPELRLPSCSSERQDIKRGLARVWKVIIAVISALLGLSSMLSTVFYFWFKHRRKRAAPSYFLGNAFLELSYGTLLKATDEFSVANMIGAGSFGSVYKGTLDEGGQLIAIKVLNLEHRGAFKSFNAECEALRNIRHRNLVKVLTACSSVDYNGNDFKALVYEFMANGSLEDWLHPAIETIDGADVIPRNLNLLQRLNIAIDVACAIVYLHQLGDIPVVHCDLKPCNILLDEEMTGRVGDFGLAKFLHEETQSSSIDQSSSIGVRGTVGYAPPEYGMGNEVSTSGDVYSYGIVLLEMFTAKRPTDDMFNEGYNLHNFVKMALPDRVVQIVDPILFEGETGEASSSNARNPVLFQRDAGEASSSNAHNRRSLAKNQRRLECLISVLGIGVACSAELPSERMNIKDAADQLVSIKGKLLGSRIRRRRLTASTSNDQD